MYSGAGWLAATCTAVPGGNGCLDSKLGDMRTHPSAWWPHGVGMAGCAAFGLSHGNRTATGRHQIRCRDTDRCRTSPRSYAACAARRVSGKEIRWRSACGMMLQCMGARVPPTAPPQRSADIAMLQQDVSRTQPPHAHCAQLHRRPRTGCRATLWCELACLCIIWIKQRRFQHGHTCCAGCMRGAESTWQRSSERRRRREWRSPSRLQCGPITPVCTNAQPLVATMLSA